jgi:hypothetical protein
MNIAYYHASKFGNGAMVAEDFKKIMPARGVTVSVQQPSGGVKPARRAAGKLEDPPGGGRWRPVRSSGR